MELLITRIAINSDAIKLKNWRQGRNLPISPAVSLFRADADKLQNLGRQTATVLQVFKSLRERPLLSVNELGKRTGLSFPAANNALNALNELGIVQEVTGQRRNRIFAYSAYLDILNEGSEPL